MSSELPLIAIAELLGIAVEDRRKVFDWSNRMIGTTDPDYGGGPDDGAAAAAELYMYANELAAQRRDDPREDIITTLITEHDGDILSEHEFDLFVLLLSVAGNETTRNGISHGLLALIEHPEAWDALKDDRELVKSAVEEMLRWGTPVNNFRRTATGDVELHGVTIREGDAVVMLYASANRDEEVFAEPFKFDVTRHPEPAPHVRRRRPALLPRRQPGPDGDADHVRGAARPCRQRRARRRGHQAAVELHPRHQAAACPPVLSRWELGSSCDCISPLPSSPQPLRCGVSVRRLRGMTTPSESTICPHPVGIRPRDSCGRRQSCRVRRAGSPGASSAGRSTGWSEVAVRRPTRGSRRCRPRAMETGSRT